MDMLEPKWLRFMDGMKSSKFSSETYIALKNLFGSNKKTEKIPRLKTQKNETR